MHISILWFVLVVCCFVSLCAFMVSKRYIELYGIFSLVFFILALILLCKMMVSVKTETKEANLVEERAVLSYYVPAGSSESESYYIATTEDGYYKICYFEEDGVTISKIKVSAEDVDIEYTEELPYTISFFKQGDVIMKIVIHIPDDANAIQLETDQN